MQAATQTPPAAVVFDPAAVRRLQNPDFGLGILRPLRGPSRLDLAYQSGRDLSLDAERPLPAPAGMPADEAAAWDVGAEEAGRIWEARWEAMEDAARHAGEPTVD